MKCNLTSSSLVFAVTIRVGSGCGTPDASRLSLEKANYQVFQYVVSIWYTCTHTEREKLQIEHTQILNLSCRFDFLCADSHCIWKYNLQVYKYN